MSEDDEIISVGDPMPAIAAVEPLDGYWVRVTWAEGTRAGLKDVIDLAPTIFTFRYYRPLRENPALLRTVHVAHYRGAIAWGEQDEIDMAATTLERLAEETLTAAEFTDLFERHGLSLEDAAAQLGLSQRTVAQYAAAERPIPRYIALACAHLDSRLARAA